jgi:uncharacterized membrane protein
MRASARLALVAFALLAIVLVVLFMTPSSYYTAGQNNATGVVTPYPTAVASSIPKVLAYAVVAILVIVAVLLIAKYAERILS